MATLPDIDTSNVSFIAYYNILEAQDGYDSWDPSEVASYGGVSSTTTYDNGLTGSVGIPGGIRTASFRAKDDGWIAVYMTGRVEERTKTDLSQPKGEWDFLYNTEQTNRGAQRTSMNPDGLTRVINGMYNQTTISGYADTSFSAGDVGVYNYWHKGTNVSHGSINANSTGGFDDDSSTASWSYDSGTNIVYGAAYGWLNDGQGGGNNGGIGGNNATDTLLSNSPSSWEWHHGSEPYRWTDYGDDPGTNYHSYANAGEYGNTTISHIIIWE